RWHILVGLSLRGAYRPGLNSRRMHSIARGMLPASLVNTVYRPSGSTRDTRIPGTSDLHTTSAAHTRSCCGVLRVIAHAESTKANPTKHFFIYGASGTTSLSSFLSRRHVRPAT